MICLDILLKEIYFSVLYYKQIEQKFCIKYIFFSAINSIKIIFGLFYLNNYFVIVLIGPLNLLVVWCLHVKLASIYSRRSCRIEFNWFVKFYKGNTISKTKLRQIATCNNSISNKLLNIIYVHTYKSN